MESYGQELMYYGHKEHLSLSDLHGYKEAT